MSMQFTKATKRAAKARVAITGPAGAGKTYTALKLATAMCKKVAVVDTEHGSASKYADEFVFDVLELDNFHPSNYVQAMQAAAAAGYDGLVIDSGSHEWTGKGGCLELVEVFARKRGGNNYAAWADVTPLHTQFIEAIHQTPLHIFATFRSKMDYVESTGSNGKKSYSKVGLAPITREGAEYEFDIVGDMDLSHTMVITKSRCRNLSDAVINHPGTDLANKIQAWLSDGAPAEAPATAPAPAPKASTATDTLHDMKDTNAALQDELQRKGMLPQGEPEKFAVKEDYTFLVQTAAEHGYTEDDVKGFLKGQGFGSIKQVPVSKFAAIVETFCTTKEAATV